MLLNIKQNKNFNLPIPFNESVGIETANYFKNLPTDIEELIIGIAGCSPYLRNSFDYSQKLASRMYFDR
jgi:hypothetical protein